MFSCKKSLSYLSEIKAEQVEINDALPALDSIETFISPYKNRLNQIMDSTLAYAPVILTKDDGDLNTSSGNLLADIVLEMGSPIFENRRGKPIDFVVLNHGGIRAPISKGDVTTRTAYEVMPFDNYISVVEMSGKAVREMVNFLIKSGRAHPIAGLQIVLEDSGELQSVNIQGTPFDEQRIYFVGTSDYLIQGGDNMGFFKNASATTTIDYLIRNAMVDYFKKVDTLHTQVDDRFIKLNQ